LYSLQHIIDQTTTLEQIKQGLSTNQQDHFIPLIDDALTIIFGNEEPDIETLEILVEQLESVKNVGFDDDRMNDEYYQTEAMELGGLSCGLKAYIDTNQPVIESTHLAIYVLIQCIEVLNLSATDNALILNLYKQAIEALTIARYATAYLDLCGDHYVEIHRDRLKKEHNISLSNRVKAQAKQQKDLVKREKYADKVYEIALKVWSIEAYVPVGALAEEINNQVYVNSDAANKGYLKMDDSKLKQYFKNQPETPSTAILKGPPSNKRTHKQYEGLHFIDFVPLLVKENLVPLD
jgi:hypothetical protein